MKKRLITLTLALILAFSLTIPAGAVMTNDVLADKIESDMDCMASAYLNTDAMSVSAFNEDGTVTYAYAVTDDVNSYVTVQNNEDGSVIMDIREEDRQDTVTIDVDGVLWVNDLKVDPMNSLKTTVVGADSGVMPLVAMQYQYSASNFTKAKNGGAYNTTTAYTYSNHYVAMGKQVRSMTGAAIGLILATYFAPGDAGKADSMISICSAIGVSLQSQAEKIATDSNAVSYKVTVYGHPINDSFESFWMHVGKYYPVSSYVGNAIYKNFYERKYYYA